MESSPAIQVKRERECGETVENESCHYYQQAVGKSFLAIRDRATNGVEIIHVQEIDHVFALKKRICVDGKARDKLKDAVSNAQGLMAQSMCFRKFNAEVTAEMRFPAEAPLRVKLASVLDDRTIMKEVADINSHVEILKLMLTHFVELMTISQTIVFGDMFYPSIEVTPIEDDPYGFADAVNLESAYKEGVETARRIVYGEMTVSLFTNDDIVNEDAGDAAEEQAANAAMVEVRERRAREARDREREEMARDARERAEADMVAEEATKAEDAENVKRAVCTCCGEMRAIIYLPNQCGHMCICGICVARMNAYGSMVCPICRTPMETITRIYYP